MNGVIRYNKAGISLPFADARYLPRYNPAGAVTGLVALRTSNSNLYVERQASTPVFGMRRFEGTPTAPTNVLSGMTVGNLAWEAWSGTAWVDVGLIRVQTTENIGAANVGGLMDFRVGQLGSASLRTIMSLRGSLGTAEILGGQTETRIIPVTNGQLRNPLNTAPVIDWGTDNWAAFGGARVTRRAAIANPAGGATIDAEARTAIIAILDALRPTTGYNLIAP